MCSCPTLFNTCMDHVLECMNHVLERMSEKSGYGVSFGTVRITDLDFADDAVILAETAEVLAGALDSLSKEAEPLGLRVSLIKIKVHGLVASWMRALSQFL